MAKSTTTITIDSDLKEYFSQSNINLSGLVNDFLRGYKDQGSNTISALNYQIKRKELEILSKDHSKLTADLRALQNELDRYDQDRDHKEVENLRSQKEHQEKLTNCQSCLNSISGPVLVKGKEYLLCVSCLNSHYGTDLSRFLK